MCTFGARELQTRTFEGSGASNTTKIPRRRHPERDKKNEGAGEGKKKRENSSPPPFGAPPFGRRAQRGLLRTFSLWRDIGPKDENTNFGQNRFGPSGHQPMPRTPPLGFQSSHPAHANRLQYLFRGLSSCRCLTCSKIAQHHGETAERGEGALLSCQMGHELFHAWNFASSSTILRGRVGMEPPVDGTTNHPSTGRKL